MPGTLIISYYSLAEVPDPAVGAKTKNIECFAVLQATDIIFSFYESAPNDAHDSSLELLPWPSQLSRCPQTEINERRWLSESFPELDAYPGSCGHMPFPSIAMFMAFDAKYPDQQIRPLSEIRVCHVDSLSYSWARARPRMKVKLPNGAGKEKQGKASCRLLPPR